MPVFSLLQSMNAPDLLPFMAIHPLQDGLLTAHSMLLAGTGH
jgi:hypothetical protein